MSFEDRYYLSDLDNCTCDPLGSAFGPECPFLERHEEEEEEEEESDDE